MGVLLDSTPLVRTQLAAQTYTRHCASPCCCCIAPARALLMSRLPMPPHPPQRVPSTDLEYSEPRHQGHVVMDLVPTIVNGQEATAQPGMSPPHDGGACAGLLTSSCRAAPLLKTQHRSVTRRQAEMHLEVVFPARMKLLNVASKNGHRS
jgi:hypothetical protein